MQDSKKATALVAGNSQVYEIPLNQIRPAPWNPPGRMDPKKVESLADSIKREGQKSAGLVRPVEAEAPVIYELVFGHRRYASKQLLVANEGLVHDFLRAEIQEMDEEHAMILAGVENLQRENPSDYEEAEFFQACAVRYGDTAVKNLSERLSVSDRYIRKRLEILNLPETALELWRSEVWHIGHMEQLLRLDDNEKVAALLKEVNQGNRKPKDISVRQLKEIIDRLAIPLHSGKFEKSDCKLCRKNTDVQRRLFGGEKEKGTKCLDQSCFLEKQQAWLEVNWPTCKANRYATQTAIIGDYNTKVTGEFSGYSYDVISPAEKCNSCPQFATVLNLQAEQQFGNKAKVCLGKSDCFAEVQAGSKKNSRSGKGKDKSDPDAPRVAWHGEHFRQQFYQQEIPLLMDGLSEEDPRRLQVALATIIYAAKTLHEWFWQKLGQEVPKTERPRESWEYFRLPFDQLLELVRTLEARQVESLMAEALVKIALRTDRGYEITFSDGNRQALAEFLNIDFARYQVTEEYLQKKTKAEMVRFIVHDSGLMEEAKFQEFMEQCGYPTAEKLAQAKKGALVDLILQCEVDLHGRLPKEIGDRPKLQEEGE